ncbi:AHH domain-containing protein [Archangium sp.]|uniref:AHH domain-containing protein n=1 Tax=Archangium sp. TaxID=1872627 RepID=UPI002D70A023|nr:AHH domain-containing protein [Archangium sp.]HYO57225.1 AHH domain-containing protein [Archangium sp.]
MGAHLVDRQVSVEVNALPGGRLRLSFEHSQLLPRDFTVDEARSILDLNRRSLTSPGLQGPLLVTAGILPCTSGCTPGTSEKLLREEYLAKYGSPTLHLPEALESSHQVMALRLSTRFMHAGFRDAAHELFNDPLFVSGVVLSTALYMAAWLAPEPFFSKALAVRLTLVLMTCFTLAEIRNVAVTVMRLYKEAEQARTLPELEKVAERFGKALGGTGLRFLVMVASYGLGKALPPTPLGGLRARQWAPAGAAALDDLLLAEATTVQVVADGSVVIAGATLGNAAAAARAESICDDGSTKNGGEWHHIATIGNRKSSARGGPWTPKFESLFARVGLSLDDSANLVHIQGHEGPHSEEYHRAVYQRLYAALRKCTSLDECRLALTNELKRIAEELCTPGTDLNRMLIKKNRP